MSLSDINVNYIITCNKFVCSNLFIKTISVQCTLQYKIGSLITLSRLAALEAALRLTGFIQNKNRTDLKVYK